jgi:enterochelin esterase-like enzyme
MTEHSIPSTHLPAPRKAWIHRATTGEAKDSLLFLDCELFTERVKAPDILREAETAGALRPVTCVYLPNASAAGRQADYTCNAAFADFLAREMPTWIEREAGRIERVFLCGLSLSALQAVFTALRPPGVFAGVLAQSPSAWWQDEWLTQSLPVLPTTPNCFWLSVGTQELQTNVSHPPTPLLQITSQLDSVRQLSAALTTAGHAIHLHEYDGGHDPTCWGKELPEALAWLMKD